MSIGIVGEEIYPYIGDATILNIGDIVDVTDSYKNWNLTAENKVDIYDENLGVIKYICDIDGEVQAIFSQYYPTNLKINLGYKFDPFT